MPSASAQNAIAEKSESRQQTVVDTNQEITANDDRTFQNPDALEVTEILYAKSGLLGDFNPEKENVELRSASAKHFFNEDGTSTAVVGAGDMHYLEDGVWKSILPYILPNDNPQFSSHRYASKYNQHKTYFPEVPGAGIVTTLEDGAFLDWGMPTLVWLDGQGQIISELSSNTNSFGTPNENKLRYENIYPNVNAEIVNSSRTKKLNYILQNESVVSSRPSNAVYLAFKENITTPNSWSLAQGQRAGFGESHGQLVFTNQQGKEILVVHTPVFHDRLSQGECTDPNFDDSAPNPDQYLEGNYLVHRNGRSSFDVFTMVPVNWLANPARKYPLTIDPTTDFYPGFTWPTYTAYRSGNSGSWACNTGAYGNRTYPNSDISYGWVDTTFPTSNPYLDGYASFNLASIPDNACLYGVTYYWYRYGGRTCGDAINLKLGMVSSNINLGNEPNCNTTGQTIRNNNGYYNGTGKNGTGWQSQTGNLPNLAAALPVDQITIGWAYDGGDDCCTSFLGIPCTGDDGDYHNVYGWESPSQKPYARITYETQSTAPTSVSGSTTICPGGSTTLTAQGGTLGTSSNYQWYANGCGSGSVLGTGQSLVVSPSSTTTYYVRRTGPCNTTSCTSVTVTVLPAFNPGSITGGGGSACSPADPGTMTVSPSGGTGSYTYQWYYVNGTSCPSSVGGTAITGATSASYNPPSGLTTTRTYQVQVNPAGSPDCGSAVWSNNCVTFTVNPLPVASATNNSPSICNNGSTNISLTSNLSGTGFTYTASGSNGNIGGYSNGSGNSISQTLTNSGTTPGTVTYTITPTVTATGCSGSPITQTVTVNPVPNVTANPSISTICSGQQSNVALTSSVAGATFSWTANSGNAQVGGYGSGNGTTISQTLTNSGSVQGTVTYTITPSANGCPGTQSTATVNVNPLPQGEIVGSTTVCSGQNTTLTFNFLYGTPPYDVTYTDGTNTFSLNDINSGHTISVSPSVTTAYAITSIVDDAGNGCTRTSNFAALAIVSVNPLPNGTISGATTICQGDATNLTFNFTAGIGPYDVEYSDGNTTYSLSGINNGHTISVSPSATTTYSIVEISDNNSCVNSSVSSSTVITVNPSPNGTMSLVTPICFGDQTTITFNFSPGTGPFDIAFTDGVSNFSLTGVNNGDTYDVTPPTSVTYNFTSITDANTCTRTSGFNPGALVIVNPLPTVSFIGLEANYCEVDNPVVLTGNNAPAGTFSGAGIVDLNNGTALFDPAAAGVGQHTVTYTYTDINSCTNSADQIVNVEEQPTANAGNGGNECDLNFDLSAVPSVGTGQWSQTGGPGFVQFSPNASDPNATVTVSQYGTYEFTWSEGTYCSDSDAISVNFYQQPVANAGSGGNECDLDFVFNATQSVTGSNGTWSQVSGPGTSSFVDATNPTTTVTVSMIGQYVFEWEEVNGTCSDAETVTVNFFAQPVANAGFGGAECDLDFQLAATPSVGVGGWTASGPGAVTFTPNASDPNAVAEVSTYGIYIFTWSEDNFGCTDDASITVNFNQQTNANAGTGGDECDLNFTFNGSPSIGTGTWTASGPGNAFYSNPNSPTATVTVDAYGSYLFTWTEVNGSCVATDQVTVNFYQQPVANAGAGGDECDLNFDFSAVPSVGNGAWSQLNGPGTSTFTVASDPTTSVTVSQYGTYTFRWTETNGTCSDSETIVVNFYEQPVANAGSGGDECDLDFSLNGTASVGVGLWTSSGPGTATFSNDISPTSNVTVSAYGTYQFTWTEINGTCTDSETITVNFYQQPVANAGLGGDECDLNFTTSAVPSFGTGTWSQTSGPGNSVFANANSATTTITVDTYGTYEFTWTETNGSCVDFRSMTVNFYQQPVADAGLGGDECDLDFTLAANASVGNGEWTYTGPGTATFGSTTAASTTVSVSQAGAYTFTWTETNGVCVDSDDVVVTFYDQPVANAGSGGDECDLNFTFSAVPSFGTGTWTVSGPGNAFFNNVNGPTSSVSVDAYGSYVFTWTEVNGICSDAASITVNFYQQPVANAGTGGSECDLDFDLNATASVGTGTWTYTGPGTATFSPNANAAVATVTVDASGSYTFTWTEDNNGCTDSDAVTVAFNTLPTVSFTGLGTDYCVDQSTPVALTGTPAGGTFTGLGISGNNFVPSLAGVGTIFVTYTYTDGNGCTDSETQTVDVNGLPTVSFSGLDPAYCEDDATAYTLSGSPAGGTFAGAGIAGSDFVPQVATNGTHVISYTYVDPFGCSSFDEQTVEVNELPVVSFSGLSPAYCVDASNVSLTGTPAGGTFAGPGIIGTAFSPVAAGVGTHTIVYSYTDGNGCSDSYTQQVTVNAVPLPVITPSGTTAICAGDALTLDAGTGYAIYDWSTNQNGQSINVTAAGNYNVTVTTFAGCVGTSADVTVAVNPLPVVDLGPDSVICTGSVVQLDAGNPGASYSWSTFEITQIINVTSTGSYEVVVTDQNNCSASDEVVVTVSDLLDPVIVADGPVIFCAGDSVILDAGIPGSNYVWSTGATTQTITVTSPGLYDVVVTDQYGCSGTDEEIVSILQLPNAVIQPTGPISICDGDTVTLAASNTFVAYEWNPGGSTGVSLDVWQSGSYTVTVTDPNNGCVATSAPVVVTVNSTVTPTIVASGDTEFCVGGSVSLSVEPGPYQSYLWTSGSTTPSIVVIETGYYGVTVEDANGCIDSTLVGNSMYIEVWDPNPIAMQSGDTVMVTNGPFSQYQWYLNGQPVPGATSATYVPSTSGNYSVQVWDENDCTGTSNNIEFTFTGIEDLSQVYNVNLYPNPTKDIFYLSAEFGRSMDVEVSLKDIAGRNIIAPEKVSGVSMINRSFNIERLSMGVYYVELRTLEGLVVEPIMKH
ncbi:MAG: hypothetical protein KDB98_02005 [Flavobacteriales bacterium]|nr:hypothetical protein [Flavobacteriales bacterium]